MALLLNMFLVLVTITSCQKKVDEVYETNEFYVSFANDFDLDKSGQEGTLFILKTGTESESDSFVENINLSSQESVNLSLDELANQKKIEISDIASIKEAKRIELNGQDCFRLRFNLTQNNIELTFIQHYYVKNGKMYVLTSSSEVQSFDKYENKINDVMLSFRLK